ncbi:MAG: hypothetical protein ACRCWG_06645 [Sarcina sp.]
MKYITFNGHTSLEQGLIINTIDIESPKPRIITETVPFHTGVYDFSTVVTGVQTYDNRKITIKFSFKKFGYNQELTYFNLSTWLLSSNIDNLVFSHIPGTIRGKCIEIGKLNKSLFGGTFTATFSCDPFFSYGSYGNQIWDTFDFNTDISQVNEWTININDSISLINEYMPVSPEIIASDNTTILLNEKQYILEKGSNKLFGFILVNGITTFEILDCSPDSRITINYNKELI